MSIPVTISYYEKLNVDGSLKSQVFDFGQKLMKDPTNPSLNIKTINNAVDKRVRTGRINKQFRAVLFELRDATTHHFVLVDVDSHDEGISKARRLDPAKLRLDVNPINGITTLIQETGPASDPAASVDASAVAAPSAPPAAASRPGDALTAHGYTPDSLYTDLGIDPHFTQQVLDLATDSDLDPLLATRPAWENEAMTGLLAGFSVDEVRDQLDLAVTSPADAPDPTDDSRVIAGLKQTAAALEFAYIGDGDTDALRNVIETGDFDKWRTFIHPEQRRMAKGDYKGSARVFGGAGTGKTVVALHRANHLITTRSQARILLTTYTRGLADGLKSQMTILNPTFPEAASPGAPGLYIENIDAIVRKILLDATTAEIEHATRSVLGVAAKAVKPYTDAQAQSVWDSILFTADDALATEIANQTFLAAEYETIVLAHGITTQAEYLRVARTGRGTPLNRKQRKLVWPLLESVLQTQAIDGKLLWPTMSAIGAAVLTMRGPIFDHVVVDEAQDFNAGHWHFLRASVAPGPNDIFLAEDSHQRIYGHPLVLSRFGISTRGRASRRLTLNYRTTRENLDYALRILDGSENAYIDGEGETDNTFGYRSARSGPEPTLVRCTDPTEEFDAAAHFIGTWLEEDPNARIGVMCRTRGQIPRILSGLRDHGIEAIQTKNADTAAHEQVSVMTMHGAKGMEFTHVVLMGVGRNILPQRFRLRGLAETEVAHALQQERSLLYVAASRARDALLVTTHGEPSDLLPEV